MINHLITQKNWQTQLSEAITSVDELLSLLKLESLRADVYVPKHFELRVPRGFVAKMTVGNSNDPLLKQVLPDQREQINVTGYVADPLSENTQNPVKGLLHKYQSRVLLTITGACAIHCRYCFRQHFDYSANMPTADAKENIVNYVTAHPEINEVILSGGDPLNVTNRRLFAWLDTLESLPQITTIRLHTRLPLVIPARLDDALLERLSQSRCHIVMVVHCNHGNEIDSVTSEHLQRARAAGITLLNQAVLLKGINDSVETQAQLSQCLFAAGVLPYYLHVLDKVAGAAHFDSDERSAIELYWSLLAALPGYLVPKLVRELPNRPFKVPINIYNAD
ncbi:EF-P beta-lysylation protein EpmB [Psychrobacter sp. AOP22-C1-22]|uniref:EF-P beta-lysylation protein EpmB n=1 Tax=unclassified Psychrobacter TaxID=196806 RepID=UPI001787EAAF|nr:MULTISPECIES: EF-P beta-lysylation protein EpmB [unclassified Psychrobacter]MDN5802449.1 EF-P beta-lysylation protein EpmB [Psychrobacter sp.]MBE0407201.1 EF-P beta-lysylation protein EpmB [Psychrobacter sp. FME6]MBE0443822.1 EF-P beta-lysylation protein EpmB [Psychrobacter sp. FME5]MDN5892193.1 EF-P beta-lysylation protein EpmB [Psychrobacter sp.]MDN5897238.1 EF-P beta-lysylation protein EpmB [Psychrobacter sp.]